MVLVTRAMEKVTVAHQVRNASFEGHEDNESAAEVAVRLLQERGLARARLAQAAEVVTELLEDQRRRPDRPREVVLGPALRSRPRA